MVVKKPLSQLPNARKKAVARKEVDRVPALATQARAVQTRDAIVRAAIKVFAKRGFDGGRVETISKLAQTHDRLIYYYFGSKEALFVEALRTVYKRMNDAESALQINAKDPAAALVAIVDFTWAYYLAHPEFITLLNTENLHEGKHLKKSRQMSALVSPAVGQLDQILAEGVTQGLFRCGVRARDLYIAIASLGYFYLSNRHTLGAFLDEDLLDKDALSDWGRFISDAVMRMVQAVPTDTQPKRPRQKRA